MKKYFIVVSIGITVSTNALCEIHYLIMVEHLVTRYIPLCRRRQMIMGYWLGIVLGIVFV